METDWLKQLDATARLGSLSAAAEELGFTQPTLSRSIKRLETDLGCELFDRTKNSMELNEAGRIVLDYAREILRSERNMRRDVDALADRTPSIRIGTCAPAPLWLLTSALVSALPGVMIGPQIMSEDQVERAIFNGDVDIAIALRAVALPAFECIPLMHEDLLLYVLDDDPLAKRDEVSFADIDGRTFMVFSAIGFWWDVCKKNLPHSRFERQTDRVVFEQVAQGSDALMFTTAAATSTSVPNRVAVPISDADAHASFYAMVPDRMGDDVKQAIRDVATF